MLTVHTARIDYAGSDRLDVTRKGSDRLGRYFAPSLCLLQPMLAARRAGRDVDVDWTVYRARYLDEMRESSREEVTLVCYCSDARRCHRAVLADLFGKLGARVLGERQGQLFGRVPR